MLNIRKFLEGLRIIPKTTLVSDSKGEFEVDDSSGKLNYHNGSSRSPVVTEAHSAVLTTKSIDADNNTITNLEVDNLKAGVLNTSITLTSASDVQVPSALAVKTYIESTAGDVQADVDDLITLSGVSAGSTDLGTFTGAIIPDSSDNKEALQALETFAETDASNLTAHISDSTDAHAGSAITNTPSGNLAATTVQGALNELQTDVDTRATATALTAHINNTTGAHAASAISNTPTGNVDATDVQGAINELQTDIDTRATSSALTAHTGASTGVHGVSGAVVGTTDTQTLSAKTLTSPIVNSPSIVTPSRLDVKQDTAANLATYATTAASGQLAFSTDSKAYYGITDNALVSLGGSSGGFDSFVNLDASELLSNWDSGDNATFLGGGTLAGTFAKETSSPLNGTASYKYTQAASSLDDYIASPVQSVPVRFRGNTVTCTFAYTYDGGSSDIEPIIYDVTNTTKLTTSTNLLPSTGTNASIYKVNVTIPSTCTQIRVGFHVKILNSGKILAFDDIQVSSDTTKYADPGLITDWQSYTPTFTGFGTPSSIEFQWRRDGSSIDIRGKFISGTPTGVEARISLPNSYVAAGATIIPSLQIAGFGGIDESAAYSYYSLIEPAVAYFTLSRSSGGDAPLVKKNGNAIAGASTILSITAKIPIAGLTASNPQIITASESFSTDTASLVYAGSGTYTFTTLVNAPVGTFITSTYAINSNTLTQTNAAAPTQTTSDMNQNGILIYPRAYNAASTSAQPSRIDIQIGKGLKGVSLNLYKSSGKSIAGNLDYFINSAVDKGMAIRTYNEYSGILSIDVGFRENTGTTTATFLFNDVTNQASGYLTINASKNPALVGVPQVQPRFATISQVVSSTTGGGSITASSYTTRTLNTLVDSTGIVTSLVANQFVLQAGTYYLTAYVPAYDCGSSRARLRNITDSTDTLLGSTMYSDSAGNVMNHMIVTGEFTITSSKTFEIQHRVSQTASQAGGTPANTGENEVYVQVTIQKVK